MAKKIKQKAVLYARVSSTEQQKSGYSIGAQCDLLREYAENNDFDIVEEYIEVESAKTSGRTQFNKMIKFIKVESKKKRKNYCRTILVEKTDRFCRNFKDYVVLSEIDVDLHIVKENIIYSEKNSRSSDKLVMGIKVVVAKNFIDNLRDESIKGMRKKAKLGMYPCRAPFGYVNAQVDNKSRLVIVPEKALIVKKIFKLYLSGKFSIRSLSAKLASLGLTYAESMPRFPLSLIHRMLRNPLYYGYFRFKGDIYKGNHVPLISKYTFDRVQKQLSANYCGKTNTEKNFLYSRLIYCGYCGCLFTADAHKGIEYYHCTHGRGMCDNKKYVRFDKLEEEVIRLLNDLNFDEKKVKYISKGIEKNLAVEQEENEELLKKYNRRIEKLNRRLKILYSDRLDGTIDSKKYKELKEEFEHEIEIIEDNILDVKKGGEELEKKMRITLELCKSLTSIYLEGNIDEKREILQILFSNFIWKDNRLHGIVRKPLESLLVTENENFEDLIKLGVEMPKIKDGVDDGTRTHNNRNHNPVLCH